MFYLHSFNFLTHSCLLPFSGYAPGDRWAAHAAACLFIERNGTNADGTGVGAGVGRWNVPARFFLNLPPPLDVNYGPEAASTTKL